MEISTIGIVNFDMLCPCFYDSTCEVTKCALIVAIDREGSFVFHVYISVQLEQPFRFTGALEAGDEFSLESWHSDEILLLRLPWDSYHAEKQCMTSLRFAVHTVIGPIGVRVASELIIAVRAAAAAATVQSNVGC
jgi:hypothetical protein